MKDEDGEVGAEARLRMCGYRFELFVVCGLGMYNPKS